METTPAVAAPRSTDDAEGSDAPARRVGPGEIDYASVVAAAG